MPLEHPSDHVELNARGLPVRSPTCEHEWTFHPDRLVHVCPRCGYEIREIDVRRRQPD